MCRAEIETTLFNKMQKEMTDFESSLLVLKPEEFISGKYAHELVYKRDFLSLFEDEELPFFDNELEFLCNLETPLNWLYEHYNDSGLSHMRNLRDFVTDIVENATTGVTVKW